MGNKIFKRRDGRHETRQSAAGGPSDGEGAASGAARFRPPARQVAGCL